MRVPTGMVYLVMHIYTYLYVYYEYNCYYREYFSITAAKPYALFPLKEVLCYAIIRA